MRVLFGVGTDHHPFDRLVEWAERWARDHPDDDVVVQHGATRAPSEATCTVEFFERGDMLEEFRLADAVVVSCGPGAVMDARSVGRMPIIVARLAARGEHVDEHQTSFARHLEARGLARVADDFDELAELLAGARSEPENWTVRPEKAQPVGISRAGELLDELIHRRR